MSSVPSKWTNKLCTHAHHSACKSAVTIFANRIYFVGTPRKFPLRFSYGCQVCCMVEASVPYNLLMLEYNHYADSHSFQWSLHILVLYTYIHFCFHSEVFVEVLMIFKSLLKICIHFLDRAENLSKDSANFKFTPRVSVITYIVTCDLLLWFPLPGTLSLPTLLPYSLLIFKLSARDSLVSYVVQFYNPPFMLKLLLLNCHIFLLASLFGILISSFTFQ
jgi:hypothetical protein